MTDAISAVEFADANWSKKHLGTLRALYGRRPHFKSVFGWLEPFYLEPGDRLADFNARTILAISRFLGLERSVIASSALGVDQTSDDRLVALVDEVGGTVYVSGKGGHSYQDPEKFQRAAIRLDTLDYQPIAYDQGRPEFEPGLSIVDALFNLGGDAVALLG